MIDYIEHIEILAIVMTHYFLCCNQASNNDGEISDLLISDPNSIDQVRRQNEVDPKGFAIWDVLQPYTSIHYGGISDCLHTNQIRIILDTLPCSIP